MLVRITNQCQMGCSHCMVDATPDGQHMEMGVYIKTLAFIERFNFRVILISGGEPTEHPHFFDMVQEAEERQLHIAILSNGMFLSDPKMKKRILGLKALVQITNDPRFYPTAIDPADHPEFGFETQIRCVSPFGRAITNNIETGRQSPLCFNLRSITRHMRDFQRAVQELRVMGKMCTPSVNVDGTLVAGESPSCAPFGTVEDSNLELTDNLSELKCSKCGLADNLDENHRKAIG